MLIWWLNQADCEAIGSLPTAYPEYLKDQYASRAGRPARGRLWADDKFGNVEVNPWPNTRLANLLGKDYAGVVIEDEDASLVRQFPGILTTTTLVRV